MDHTMVSDAHMREVRDAYYALGDALKHARMYDVPLPTFTKVDGEFVEVRPAWQDWCGFPDCHHTRGSRVHDMAPHRGKPGCGTINCHEWEEPAVDVVASLKRTIQSLYAENTRLLAEANRRYGQVMGVAAILTETPGAWESSRHGMLRRIRDVIDEVSRP